jgi:hypothetical protein
VRRDGVGCRRGREQVVWPQSGLLRLPDAIAHERGERPGWIKLPFLASVVFERVFYDNLRALIAFAQHSLSLSPPWQVECGLVGVQGLHVGLSPNDIRGPVRRAEVTLRRTPKSDDETAIDKCCWSSSSCCTRRWGRRGPRLCTDFLPAGRTSERDQAGWLTIRLARSKRISLSP